MRSNSILKPVIFVLMLLVMACGGGGDDPSGPDFQDLIDEGWAAFQQGDYQTAVSKFTEASNLNRDDAAGFTGLGWSLFKLDNLSRANSEFTGGSNTLNPTADLFGGWAFVKNAQKDYFAPMKGRMMHWRLTLLGRSFMINP